MTENPSNPNKELLAAMAKAQGEMQTLVASETAKAGSYTYNYADLAGVYRVLRQPLANNELGVYQFPEVFYDGGVFVEVSTTVYHASGQGLTLPPLRLFVGQSATPQQVGSGITYARRYSLMALFGLAPADDDGAAAAQSAAKAPPQAQAQTKPKPQPTPQPTPQQVEALDENKAVQWAMQQGKFATADDALTALREQVAKFPDATVSEVKAHWMEYVQGLAELPPPDDENPFDGREPGDGFKMPVDKAPSKRAQKEAI